MKVEEGLAHNSADLAIGNILKGKLLKHRCYILHLRSRVCSSLCVCVPLCVCVSLCVRSSACMFPFEISEARFLAISVAFAYILMGSESMSVVFNYFQSISVTFNQYRSLPVTFNHVDSVKTQEFIDWELRMGGGSRTGALRNSWRAGLYSCFARCCDVGFRKNLLLQEYLLPNTRATSGPNQVQIRPKSGLSHPDNPHPLN